MNGLGQYSNMKRVLVVAAHPDDEILGCGGTIARLSEGGSLVHILIIAEGLTSRAKNRDEGSAPDVLAAFDPQKIQIDTLCNGKVDARTPQEAIKEAVLFKKSIVLQDEHDQQIRQTLNLGHTIGHAIESASLLSTQALLHGEAVMLGLIYELMLSHLMFDLPKQNIEQLLWMKQRIFPGLHRIFTFDELIPFIKQDKKNNTNIQMSLLTQVGLGVWQQAVTDTQVQTAINMTEQLLIKTY